MNLQLNLNNKMCEWARSLSFPQTPLFWRVPQISAFHDSFSNAYASPTSSLILHNVRIFKDGNKINNSKQWPQTNVIMGTIALRIDPLRLLYRNIRDHNSSGISLTVLQIWPQPKQYPYQKGVDNQNNLAINRPINKPTLNNTNPTPVKIQSKTKYKSTGDFATAATNEED